MITIEFTGTLQELHAKLGALINATGLGAQCRLTVSDPIRSVTPEERARIAAAPFVERGEKIGAIKAVRTETGKGLAEARDWVELTFPSMKR